MDIYRWVGRGHHSAYHTSEVTRHHCHCTLLVRAITATPIQEEGMPTNLWPCFQSCPSTILLWRLHAYRSGRSFTPFLDSAAWTHKEKDNLMIPQMWDEAKVCHTVVFCASFRQCPIKQLMPIFFMHNWVKQIWSLSLFLSENSTWTVEVLDYVSVLRMHPLHKLWALCICFNSVWIRNIMKHEKRKLRICENYNQLLA